ncbi:MAG: cwlD [Firmicutes bacterium]|nr:cwlD [Bacillota bacterium]
MRIKNLRGKSVRIVVAISLIAVVITQLWSQNIPNLKDIEAADLSILSGRIIVLDPGHGGIDSGAQGNGFLEKDITLALAIKIGKILENNGATVIFTRDSDIDYYTRGKGGKRKDLLKRVEIINNSGAEAFVSIHTNAIRGKEWFGAEVYYNPKLAENQELGETMQQSLKNFSPGNKRQSRKDLNILVLKNSNLPGVLVEAGFLTNSHEANLLADDGYQTQMAEHIVKALAYHFCHSVAR